MTSDKFPEIDRPAKSALLFWRALPIDELRQNIRIAALHSCNLVDTQRKPKDRQTPLLRRVSTLKSAFFAILPDCAVVESNQVMEYGLQPLIHRQANIN